MTRPVPQLIIYRSPAHTPLFNHMGRLFFQDCGLHAVPFAGIDHRAAGLGVGLCHILFIHCPKCGNVPVPEEELPTCLPAA